MNKLYLFRLSVGLPRQRAFRTHRTVVASGRTHQEARTKAFGFLNPTLSPGHMARFESFEVICATPDDVVRGPII